MSRLVRLKKIFVLFLSFFITFSVAACGKKSEGKKEEPFIEVEYEAEDIFSAQDVIDDLTYIKGMIEKIHPNPYGNYTEEEFNNKWVQLEKELKEEKNFLDVNCYLQRAVAITGDVNTYVESIKDKNQLPIDFEWNGEGLWIKNSKIDDLNAGDKVIRINNVTVDELLSSFRDIIPSENLYYTRAKAAELLKEKYICENLEILSGENKVKIETLGNDSDIKIQHISFNKKEVNSLPLKNEYKINNSNKIALLKLYNLNYDDEFKNLLEKFFTEIKGGQVEKVAVDLRECENGEVEALNEILKYTNADDYVGYNIEVKKSSEAKKANIKGKGFFSKLFGGDKIKINKNDELKFEGNLYFLTSNSTRGAAGELATIVKDNKIGEVVGQYTGSNPSGYGKSVEVKVPNCRLKLRISTSELIRPSKDERDTTLVPDKYVPAGVSKYTKGIDLELNEILKQKKVN